MNCKDCINADVCNCCDDVVTETIATNLNENNDCNLFKDKSKMIQLPCNIGDIVYSYSDVFGRVLLYIVEECYISWSCMSFRANCDEGDEWIDDIDFDIDDIGKTVFLTKEEAEAKLKCL